jgi:hypothetical protein
MEQKVKGSDTPGGYAAPSSHAAPRSHATPGNQAASGGVGGASPRNGQSGEGARSAFEHLVEQQKKRDAQRLREAEAPPAGPSPTPLSAPDAGTDARCPGRGPRT